MTLVCVTAAAWRFGAALGGHDFARFVGRYVRVSAAADMMMDVSLTTLTSAVGRGVAEFGDFLWIRSGCFQT